MNRQQKPAHRRVRNPAYRPALQRLEEALVRACQRNQAYEDLVADEKLTRARLALFGCALLFQRFVPAT